MDENKIDVIYVEPMKEAKVIEINEDLDSMQKLVGGRIEEYMPFDDEVAIICNEEGKMSGEQLNRGICDDDGQLLDIIAGPFFIAYAPIESEVFLPLPKELKEKYESKFRKPERFYRDNDGSIIVKKVELNQKELER